MGHLYEYELFILIGRFLHRWQEDVTRERDFGTFFKFFFFFFYYFCKNSARQIS